MPFLLVEILNFQGSAHLRGVGSLSNLVQLMIKLPSGLGICFCIISINKKIFLKPLSMVGKIAYELYLVHGYILENVNASINGCFAFWIFSLFIAIVLHELLTLIRKYMVMIMKVQ